MIDYERLQRLFGAKSYDQLRSSHKGWVEDYLGDGAKGRQEQWTSSIAVGSSTFIERVRALLGFRARGRVVVVGEGGYQLREGPGVYNAFFGAEKDDIGPENAYFWDSKTE